MRAQFWTASDDGSSWYRATQPAAALGWLGHDAAYGEMLTPYGERADVIVGSRIAQPAAVDKWLGLARGDEGRPKLVLDLDDNYFQVEPRNKKAFEFWSRPDIRRGLNQSARYADLITCASTGIAESVDEFTGMGEKTRVIPNGLHAMYLGIQREYSDDRPVVIGWSGTAATAHDFYIVDKQIMRALSTLNVGAAFIGLPDVLGPRGKNVARTEWVSPNERYLDAVRNFDIWLAPYQSNPFTDAKFPTKALEAGMLGIPLIASDIRPYREWITHGVNGYLVPADQPHLWGRYIKTLVENPALRRKMGEAARSRASRNILQEVGRQWESVLFS